MSRSTLRVSAITCVLLGTASGARATIRPPVKITMPPETQAAISGQEYQGVFEVDIREPGRLADFRIVGEGWTVHFMDVAEAIDAEIGTIRIPFRAVPIDADERITLNLTYNGRPVSRGFKIGPAQFALRGRSYPGGPVDAIRGEVGCDFAARSDSEPGPSATPSTNGAAQPAAPSAGGVNVRVTGQIVYRRTDGLVVGVDSIWIQVKDDDNVAEAQDDTIWEGYTDQNGFFDTGNYVWDDPGGPDVYLHWESDTGVVNVQDGDDVAEADWSWSTEDTSLHHEDWPGGDIHYGQVSACDTFQYAALHIHNSIVRAHRFMLEEAGIDVPEVDVRWPVGSNASYSGGEIDIGNDRRWNEGTHTHEYGHHVLENFSANVSPDYCNGFCDGTGSCDFDLTCPDPGHCGWCRETEHDAWNEGWPNWLADVVTRAYPSDYQSADGCPLTALMPRPAETLDVCCVDSMSHDAFLTENFVHALLADIDDAANDDHDTDGIQDCLSLGFDEIFTLALDFDVTTINQFLTTFWAIYPQHRPEFWKTAFNVDPDYTSVLPADAAAPAAVTNVWSPTHPLGSGPLPCITAMWDPPADDVTGAVAYSHVWHGTPDPGLEPGLAETVFAGCEGTAFSPPVMPGEDIFLRIRARDNAGRWGPASGWFGPISVSFEECATNANGVPDVCDAYCNFADAPISCQDPIIYNYCAAFTSCGTALDCNTNALPDDCDIAEGTSLDCGGDGVPDECQQHRFWIKPDGGIWNDGANWDTAPPPETPPCSGLPVSSNPGLPGPADDACMNVESAVGIEHSGGVSSVRSIFCHEGLSVTGGTLSLSNVPALGGPSFVQESLFINPLGKMEIHAPKSLDVYGTLGLFSQNTVLKGTGTTRAHGGMTVQQLPIIDNGHKLENFGLLTTSAGLVVTNGSLFINRPGGEFRKETGYYYAFSLGTGIFVNEGTFRKLGTDAAEIAIAVVNDGLIHVESGDLAINPLFAAGSTCTGTYLGDAGTVIHFIGGRHYFYSDSAIVADAVRFDNFGSGTIEIQGTYNVATSTTLRASQPITFTTGANVIDYGATVTVQAPVNFNAMFGAPIAIDTLNVISGTAAFNSGDPVNVVTLNLGNQGGTIRGPSPITVSGLITWTLAGHFFDAGVVNANGGLLVPANSAVRNLNQRTFNNAGPATLLGSVDMASGAVFNNLATGVVDIQADGTVFGGGGAGPVINNAGSWRKSAGSGTSRIDVNFINTGAVEAQVGDLRFHNATYTQTAGSTLLTGGSITAITQGGTATGTLDLQGGVLGGDGSVFAHVASVAATVAPGLSAGVLDIGGNYTQGATAALEIELGGATQGTDYDLLAVTGSTTLGGTLRVELINGFVPALGEQFIILTAGSVTNTFAAVEMLPPGFNVEAIYNPDSVVLEITSAGVPAATITGAVLRKPNVAGPGGFCDLPVDLAAGLPITTEPRTGEITELRVTFDVAPESGGTSPVTIEQAVCPSPPAYAPYTGVSTSSATVAGNELVLTFSPALENARTYRLTFGPEVTSIPNQAVEVRGLIGDVNHNGLVNGNDRSVIIGAWTSPASFSCVTDLNSSGATNGNDRSIVIGAWTGTGTNCAP